MNIKLYLWFLEAQSSILTFQNRTIAALETTVAALETTVATQNKKITALEARKYFCIMTWEIVVLI